MNDVTGEVRNIHYGDIHTKLPQLLDARVVDLPRINDSESLQKFKERNFCKANDMIFADASEDIEDIGKCIEIIDTNQYRILSGLHTIHARQRSPRFIIGFAVHLFHSKAIRTQIQRESQGAKVLGISRTRLSSINICFPDKKLEQQKIADCLGSLDELIAAHSRKLDALQDHKKGLLQNLFPAQKESEKSEVKSEKCVPKFRFLGFTKDWQCDSLSEVMREHGHKNKKSGCEVFSVSQEKGLVNQIKHLGRSFSAKDTSNYNKVLPHNIVYTKSPLRDYPYGIVKQSKLDKDVAVSPLYGVFTPLNKHLGVIIEAYFESPYRSKSFIELLAKKGAKNTINIPNTTFLSGRIILPDSESEQQKIADCLTSLDALITAQIEQIAALKAHKKGLMQQLFPNPELSKK